MAARAATAGAAALGLGGLLLMLVLATAVGGDSEVSAGPAGDGTCTAACSAGVGWNPGNIISDRTFYNTRAMTVGQVRAFINRQGARCSGLDCLRTLNVTTPAVRGDRYCRAVPAASVADAAAVITGLSVACGVNPQVMLVTLQKESQLLTRTDPTPATYRAAWGWNCPDTGPGGAAFCDPASAGFFHQALGMARQSAKYRLDPDSYRYRAGHTATILWNVAETGCGGVPVRIVNTATASLYDYTPYQPNPASLAAYPGAGDRCSSYGNRNFFYLFQHWFGPTGGGTPTTARPTQPGGGVALRGVAVTLPSGPDVDPAVAGKTITAPTPAMAKGLAAGLATVGMPYVYGGGTDGGPPDQGCARAGGALNSCQGLVGFDCSGLTAYVLARAGYPIPDNSAGQRADGQPVPRDDGEPGDIIGYPGHVAVYLGLIGGTAYLLEAPEPGRNIHIRTAYWTNEGQPVDTFLHRYWTPPPAANFGGPHT